MQPLSPHAQAQATSRPILVASADVSQGEAVLTVPDSAWLSPAVTAKTNVGKLAAAAGLEPWLQLALVLVADRFAGAKSELSGYAEALPEDLGTPLLWSDAELAELQGTQVLQTLTGYL